MKLYDNTLAPNPRRARITALCAIDFGNRVGLPVPERNAHTLRWHATVSARPSAAA